MLVRNLNSRYVPHLKPVGALLVATCENLGLLELKTLSPLMRCERRTYEDIDRKKIGKSSIPRIIARAIAA